MVQARGSGGPARRAAQVAARGKTTDDVIAICVVAPLFRGVSHARAAGGDGPPRLTLSLNPPRDGSQ